MRVLHLPTNIASQISVTVRALRDIGVDARGLVRNNSPIQDGTGIETFTVPPRRSHPIGRTVQRARWQLAVVAALRWADVVHWHFGARVLPGYAGLWVASFLGKARIAQFWGTEIRVPEIAAADNPYMASMYEMNPHLAKGVGVRSRRTQSRFARCGFECLVPGFELESYVDESIFPSVRRTRAALPLSEFSPKPPEPEKRRPLVVHAPSHKAKKGTEVVIRVIDQLRETRAFDFRLLHGVPHAEARAIVRECDIVLDQFVLGAHGLVTLEAMALGKPAVCYVKPSLVPRYPPDCPIVNANQDDLAEVLGGLLDDGRRRHEIGRQGRAYVEKYHDARKIAKDLVGIYEELLRRTPGRGRRRR